MGVYYCKQPNGLYCRFSTIVDTVTSYNMDKAGLKELFIEKFGEEDPDVINFEAFLSEDNKRRFRIYPFNVVVNRMTSANETIDGARSLMKEMGYNDPFWYPLTWDDDKRRDLMASLSSLFSELNYSDEQITDVLQNTHCSEHCLALVKEDGKRYLEDRDDEMDNFGYRVEIV